MERTVLFGQIAGVFALFGYYFYIRSIFVNKDKDKSLTAWIIWTVVGFLIFKSYLTVGQDQTEHSKWVLLVYTFGPPVVLLTLIFVFHSRQAPFSLLDKIFLTMSALSGLYLWRYNEGLLPLHVNMAIDISGGYLIGRNAWHDPEAEDKWAWTFFTLASCINLLAVQRWTYSLVVYPLFLAVMCISIMAAILFRPKRQNIAVSSEAAQV